MPFAAGAQINQPVGQWNSHFSHRQGQVVAWTPERFFCLTNHGLFYVTRYGEAVSVAKEEGLSEALPTTIAYSVDEQVMALAYESGLIDLIYADSVIYTAQEIARKRTAGAKSIHRLEFAGRYLYIASSLGLIKYDVRQRRVVESYRYVGPNGAEIEAYSAVEIGDTLFVATNHGILKAALDAPNLLDFQHWEVVSPKVVHQLFHFRGDLVTYHQATLWRRRNGAWEVAVPPDSVDGGAYLGGHVTGPWLALGNEKAVLLIDSNWRIQRFGGAANDALYDTSRAILWLGSYYGLVSYHFNLQQWFYARPESPVARTAYRMLGIDSTLYLAAGGQANWTPTYNPSGIAWFRHGRWTNLTASDIYQHLPDANDYKDAMALAMRRSDGSLFVGSFTQGLLQLQGGKPVRLFTARTAPLDSAPDGRTPIVALLTDAHDNLWMINYYSAYPIRVLTRSGRWVRLYVPDHPHIGDFVIDSAGHFWGTLPTEGGILLYSTNGTLDNPADDRYVRLSTQEGKGNLPSLGVHALTIDRDGVLWIGTDDGVAVLDFPEYAFEGAGNYDVRRILLPEEQAYLLQGITVSTIAVDAGNNKWIGTDEGLFYVSEDGRRIYYHFTAENSPLPSNTILHVAVVPYTGEVFISTDQGICSFQGLAVETPEPPTTIRIFPNPVMPDYDGPIMIENVPTNARIRVVDAAGNLVYADRAVGNRAIWDGADLEGRKIAPGVYYIMALPTERARTFLGKVLILR